ncbi:hypothetical protein Efla_000956 [Eimeria flavescens]
MRKTLSLFGGVQVVVIARAASGMLSKEACKKTISEVKVVYIANSTWCGGLRWQSLGAVRLEDNTVGSVSPQRVVKIGASLYYGTAMGYLGLGLGKAHDFDLFGGVQGQLVTRAGRSGYLAAEACATSKMCQDESAASATMWPPSSSGLERRSSRAARSKDNIVRLSHHRTCV